jgi:2-keto-4-pentenoate hydratase/2-oxohepta-3-ene-1,7-dioic acid hydratase in catechol pathway
MTWRCRSPASRTSGPTLGRACGPPRRRGQAASRSRTSQAGFLGYACFNDLSARGFQLASDRWTLGKNADDSGPLGPWIVTADEIPDPGHLRIQTRVNGNTVQDGNTSDLIFSGAQIAAYASGVMTLKPGDLIATGTPDGIGATRTPPVFLQLSP